MKMLKNLTAIALAAVMATALVGCGSSASSSTPASSTPASSAPAASSEAVDTSDAEYPVTNTTGMNVTELYLYPVDAEDKGENYAGEGMADGDSVTLTIPYSEEAAAGVYVLEFTTEDGNTQSFDTLHFEVAAINLLSVDAAAGATAIAFGH